jgi:hypothetical protein
VIISRSKSLVVAAGMAGILALSGCSLLGLGSGSGQQSTAEACLSLLGPLREATTEFTTALGKLQSDPLGTIDEIENFADSLKSAASEITNEDVKAAATKAEATVRELVALLDGYANDPATVNQADLDALLMRVQNDIMGLANTCT